MDKRTGRIHPSICLIEGDDPGDAGGSGSGGPDGGDKSGGGDGKTADKTFTQADVDRIVGERVTRTKAQFADYDELKRKAADADRLAQERETEAEKAVRTAREEGKADGLKAMQPKLVLAELRAVSAGRVDAARFAELTEDLDLSKYLDTNGEVDMDRVKRKVDAWAPPKQDPPKDEGQGQKQVRRPKPDASQSTNRPEASPREQGEEEARRRFGDRARVSKQQ